MCGIVGVVTGKNNQYDLPEIVNKMARKIIHRGPDNRGVFFEAWSEKKFKQLKLENYFKQDNISISKKNVLRGFQGDKKTWKLIS